MKELHRLAAVSLLVLTPALATAQISDPSPAAAYETTGAAQTPQPAPAPAPPRHRHHHLITDVAIVVGVSFGIALLAALSLRHS